MHLSKWKQNFLSDCFSNQEECLSISMESLEELDPLANHHVAAMQMALLDPQEFQSFVNKYTH